MRYDLVTDGIGQPLKLPCKSPKGQLTLVRFTAPTHRHPKGQLVAAGHPPFCPSVLGMTLVERA